MSGLILSSESSKAAQRINPFFKGKRAF